MSTERRVVALVGPRVDDNLTRWAEGMNGSRRISLRSSVSTVGPAVGLAPIRTIDSYDRKLEQEIKRMDPRDLDAMLRDDE